jgi:cytosine/adenosine deaminase-related metal-dependent hydrolase
MTFINGDVGGRASALRIEGARIAAVGVDPQPGDVVIDLRGDRLLPGLINAHDHLQLNNFRRLKYRDRYCNVAGWIEDVTARVETDTVLKTCGAIARDERLLIGGIKNLLSGVTTVAHHDPLYESLTLDIFPTRVVSGYGWSHSLSIDGDERVRQSYQQTPVTQPWIIHAAEGVDQDAASEFDRLEALGCVGSNTLIVHGVALDRVQRNKLAVAGAGLIWCPASNLHLFGRTADVTDLVGRGHVALGTDSRLSGACDLLGELRVARELGGFDDATLESLVTTSSARLLKLADRGVLRPGAAADILVVPQAPLSMATRTDVRLVMIAGRMLYADAHYARDLAPSAQWVHVTVDGMPKAMDRRLAMLIEQSGIQEPGLDLSSGQWRAA